MGLCLGGLFGKNHHVKSIGTIQQEAEDVLLVQSDVLQKEREGTLKARIKVQPLVDPFHKFREGTAASLSTSKQFNIPWIPLQLES